VKLVTKEVAEAGDRGCKRRGNAEELNLKECRVPSAECRLPTADCRRVEKRREIKDEPSAKWGVSL
jgi:hypothetical protein